MSVYVDMPVCAYVQIQALMRVYAHWYKSDNEWLWGGGDSHLPSDSTNEAIFKDYKILEAGDIGQQLRVLASSWKKDKGTAPQSST